MPPYYYSEEDSSLILKCVCERESMHVCTVFKKRKTRQTVLKYFSYAQNMHFWYHVELLFIYFSQFFVGVV